MTTNIQSKTEYDYNTITKQMGFRRKSNDLFESVSHVLLKTTVWLIKVPKHMVWLRNKKNVFFCYALFTKDLWDNAELLALGNKEVPRRIKVFSDKMLIVILVKEILLYTCIVKSLLEPP